jgi:transposase
MKRTGNLSDSSPTKREQWQQNVAKWRASGMTQTAYCRQHHLSRYQLVYWKRLLVQGAKIKARFVAIPDRGAEVNLLQQETIRPLSLVIGNRYRLEIPAGTDRDSLRTILEVLEDR